MIINCINYLDNDYCGIDCASKVWEKNYIPNNDRCLSCLKCQYPDTTCHGTDNKPSYAKNNCCSGNLVVGLTFYDVARVYACEDANRGNDYFIEYPKNTRVW